MAIKRHIKLKAGNALVDNDDFSIPAGKTIVISALDFSAPTGANAGVKVYVGDPTPNALIALAQSDKYVLLPPGEGVIDGPMTIRCQLDNSNNPNGALLGVTIYYEDV